MKKRLLCLLTAMSLLLSLCACAGGDGPSGSGVPAGSPGVQSSAPQGGGESVTITIPAEFVDTGMTQDQLDQEVQAGSVQSAVLNGDGSVTYTMTAGQHREVMGEVKAGIDTGLAEITSSGSYPNVVSVEANEDYTLYTVTLSAEEVDAAESMLVMAFYIFSGLYHVFNGTDVENVAVRYVSQATGEVIREINSNDLG